MQYRFEHDEDRVRFAKLMASLSECYRKPISEECIRSYEMALSDVPIRQLGEMAIRHMRTCKFFPAPCELRPEIAGSQALRYRRTWINNLRGRRNETLEHQRQAEANRHDPPRMLESYKSIGQVLKINQG